MLLMLIVLAVLSAMVAGFWAGKVHTENVLADKMKTDPKFGKTLLEYLARLWGAKLELFSGPEAAAPPPPKG